MQPTPSRSTERWARVLAHRDRLLNLVRARGVGRDDAEDVVQEALLRAATFEALDEDRLGQLLTTVTTRLCVDEHRRRERAWRLSRRLPVEPVAEAADEGVCDKAEAAWAAAVVGTLPPIQQAVLAARAEGLSYEEISRRHRLSYKSVESAASRARATVRRALAATLALAAFGRRHATAPAVVATAAVLTLGGAPPAVRVEPAPAPATGAYVAAPRPRPAVTRPAPRRAVRRPATPPARPAVARPRAVPSRAPLATVGDVRVEYDDRHDEYSTQERLAHCLEHGVELRPTIRCRYPKEPG